jgi:predicted RNase H-like nuclease (RuvC/YqgF family)
MGKKRGEISTPRNEFSERTTEMRFDESIAERLERLERKMEDLEKFLDHQIHRPKGISIEERKGLEDTTLEYEMNILRDKFLRTERELDELERELNQARSLVAGIEEGETLFVSKLSDLEIEFQKLKNKKFLIPFIGCLVVIQVMVVLYLFLLL